MYTNKDYVKAIAGNLVSPAPRRACVAMFHAGRSGSTVLGSLFNQNLRLFWDSEVFAVNRMPKLLPSFLNNLLLHYPDMIVRVRRQRTRRPIYGFEAKMSHATIFWGSIAECISHLEKLSFDRFIVLRRRNHLRVIISDLIARNWGHWHVTEEPLVPKKVHVNADAVDLGSLSSRQLLPLAEHIRRANDEFDQLEKRLSGKPILKLIYEEHVRDDPRVAYRLACDFLEIEPGDVFIKYKKTNPFIVKELVTNYEELLRILEGSPFEWMLYD